MNFSDTCTNSNVENFPSKTPWTNERTNERTFVAIYNRMQTRRTASKAAGRQETGGVVGK